MHADCHEMWAKKKRREKRAQERAQVQTSAAPAAAAAATAAPLPMAAPAVLPVPPPAFQRVPAPAVPLSLSAEHIPGTLPMPPPAMHIMYGAPPSGPSVGPPGPPFPSWFPSGAQILRPPPGPMPAMPPLLVRGTLPSLVPRLPPRSSNNTAIFHDGQPVRVDP